MKEKTAEILNQLYQDYPVLQELSKELADALDILLDGFEKGNKLLICGNGGSAADSEHIVGELMKGFRLKRPLSGELKCALETQDDGGALAELLQEALPAISLSAHTAFSTAFNNDVSAEHVFAQQVLGYGKEGDILLGITTSGNSKNVVNGVKTAKVLGMRTIGLTGADGGKLKALCDVTITVPEQETYRVQELHIPVYHALCAAVENEKFGIS